jgi:hypothetical protein
LRPSGPENDIRWQDHPAAARQDGGVRGAAGANAGLAFLLELGLLAAMVTLGVRLEVPLPVRVLLAVLLPGAVIAVWGLLVAPRAPRRLPVRPRFVLQAVLFGLGALALAAAGLPVVALVFAVVAAAHLVLRLVLRQA